MSVPIPQAAPAAAPENAAEQALREATAELVEADILALCYAFKGNRQRLRLYADILRQRGGARAQFASCLICYDRARQGDSQAQGEFTLLAATMRQLAAQPQLVETLLGNDAYLNFIWELCSEALQEMDEAAEASAISAALAPPPSQPILEVPLLDDRDFGDELSDFVLAANAAALQHDYDTAVNAFLGSVAGAPMYIRGAGFRMQHSRDVQRIETCLTRLAALSDVLPQARGFRALVLLFYGSQMRPRTLFGGINTRKQTLLCEGLSEFLQAGEHVWQVVGALEPLHCEPGTWAQMMEILWEFVRFLQQSPLAVGLTWQEQLRVFALAQLRRT